MKTKLLEILPGALTWLTLGLLFFLSFRQPVLVAVFIILFDCYWLFKTLFLYLHLHTSFKQTRVNQGIDWLQRLDGMSKAESPVFGKPSELKNWRDIYHLIVLPMYKEPCEVIRESFLSLSNINYPKEKTIVVLAIEERAGEVALATAQKIREEFGNEFFKFLISHHPADLPGEIAGKGANETWAIKEAKKSIIDPLKISYEDILLSPAF